MPRRPALGVRRRPPLFQRFGGALTSGIFAEAVPSTRATPRRLPYPRAGLLLGAAMATGGSPILTVEARDQWGRENARTWSEYQASYQFNQKVRRASRKRNGELSLPVSSLQVRSNPQACVLVLRRAKPSPSNPIPSSTSVAGSGT